MEANSFLVEAIELEFENAGHRHVALLGPAADKQRTHISLIVGANGTSKSRLLASLVEQLCEIQARRTKKETHRRFSASGTHGLLCTGLSILANGQPSQGVITQHDDPDVVMEPPALPSRILVLSNLVMDKFHFPKEDTNEVQFYHYLGVRQATNLTTTGSLERSVSEAVLRMAADPDRLDSFQSWVGLLFGGSRELAFQFPKLKRSEITQLLDTPDKTAYVLERMRRRLGSVRSNLENEDIANEIAHQVTQLFEFIADKVTEYQTTKKNGRQQTEPFLRLSTLRARDRIRLSQMAPNFSAAQRAGFSAWPSICLEASPWLSLNQFSSGEQNMLSVGAKLIAYSSPGCLVAIDEPEVSLNVAWQQHYTDLIQRSLSHAPGSHVLIATHSPHLIASAPAGNATVVLVEKTERLPSFKTVDADFEGWGAESVLYQVLGIPSASSHLFNKELAQVLKHLQNGGKDQSLIDNFLKKAARLDFQGIEPLEEVIAEIRNYRESLN